MLMSLFVVVVCCRLRKSYAETRLDNIYMLVNCREIVLLPERMWQQIRPLSVVIFDRMQLRCSKCSYALWSHIAYRYKRQCPVRIALEAGSFLRRCFFAGTRRSCFCLEANAIRDLRSVTFIPLGDKCRLLAVVATVCSCNISFQLHDSILSMVAVICNHG